MVHRLLKKIDGFIEIRQVSHASIAFSQIGSQITEIESNVRCIRRKKTPRLAMKLYSLFQSLWIFFQIVEITQAICQIFEVVREIRRVGCRLLHCLLEAGN